MLVSSTGVANVNNSLCGPSLTFPKDWSPLHIAAFRNETWRLPDLSMAQAVDQKDRLGISPIHVAAEQGNALAVHFLIGLGARVNDRDGDGWTALHYAAAGGRLEAIKMLCNGGADINAVASGGTTPLHLASGFDHLDAVKLLRDRGADANAVDVYERRAPRTLRTISNQAIVGQPPPS